MLVDLVLVALLALAFKLLTGALPRWSGTANALHWRDPLVVPVALAVVLACASLLQAAWVFGPGDTWEYLQGELGPAERRACLAKQEEVSRNLSAGLGDVEPACPVGGGRFTLANRRYACEVHGSAR